MEYLCWLVETKTPPVQVAEGQDCLGHKQEYVGYNNQMQLAQGQVQQGCAMCKPHLVGVHICRRPRCPSFLESTTEVRMQDTRSEQLVSCIF